MSRDREVWSMEHRVHVYWFEKILATVVFLVGLGMIWVFRLADWPLLAMSAAVSGLGLYGALPSVRPALSFVVDRLPFLASKSEDRP